MLGSNLEVDGDEASGLAEVRSSFLSEEKVNATYRRENHTKGIVAKQAFSSSSSSFKSITQFQGLREGAEGEQEPRIGREERERVRKKDSSRSNLIERESTGGKEEKEEPAAEKPEAVIVVGSASM